MNAKELNRCLEDVLLDDRFSSPLRKAKLIISLCSYYSYSSETENSEINHELEKLSSMIINYAVLEDLIKTLNELIDKRVHWQPHLYPPLSEIKTAPQNITLSPTFNFGTIDLSGILSEIDKIRTDINNVPINLSLLISFIARQAEKRGDINKK